MLILGKTNNLIGIPWEYETAADYTVGTTIGQVFRQNPISIYNTVGRILDMIFH